MNYEILTDSNSEILCEWEDQYGIQLMKMPYSVDNVEYEFDLGRHLDITAFYEKMRGGSVPVTAQRNPQEFTDWFRPLLEQGKDLIYIAFSSKLSGTFNCAEQAIRELEAEFPDRRIAHIDTLAISLAEGLLVHKAAQMRQQGKSMDAVVDFVEQNKMHINAWFTVDDLIYLKRGGRVSSAAAAMGTILDVKPILNISADGQLTPIEKVKGRRKAVRTMLNKLTDCHVDLSYPVVVLHADSLYDAEYMKTYIKERYDAPDILVRQIGPVVGAHVGPGALALVFMGDAR